MATPSRSSRTPASTIIQRSFLEAGSRLAMIQPMPMWVRKCSPLSTAGCGPALLAGPAELLQERVERLTRQERVELFPIVVQETDAFDQHVVDPPPLTVPEAHRVVHVERAAPLRRDLGLHRGALAVDPVAQVLELRRVDQVDAGDVRATKQTGEERRELRAFLGRPRLPVAAQRRSRH